MKRSDGVIGIIAGVVLVLAMGSILTAVGQTNRARVRPTATPTPSAEPVVISRADDFLSDQQIQPEHTETKEAASAESRMIDELRQRIRLLESDRKKDPDAKQKRLLLNLDILTRSEQRAESLRKQLFEMIEKEGSIQAKLETIDLDLRPEIIERTTSLSGSLRPEEIRDARKRALTAEKTRLQSLLSEVQKNKASLELNIQKADDLVERLRVKMEKEIDKALSDDETEN